MVTTIASGGPVYSQPDNTNSLQNNHFELVIHKLPNTRFFCQKVKLPSMKTTKTVIQKTPFNEIPRQGQKILMSEFEITFMVSEDLSNYLEIVKWIFDGTLSRQFQPNYTPTHHTDGKVYSDGEVHVLSSRYSPNFSVKFTDLFPVELSELEFSTTENTPEYLTATAKFKFTYFDYIVNKD